MNKIDLLSKEDIDFLVETTKDLVKEFTINPLNKDVIKGSRRLSNYIWIVLLYIGGLGFFLAGLSSYFQKNLIAPKSYKNTKKS